MLIEKMGIAGKKVLLTTSHKDIRSGGAVQMYLLAKELVSSGAIVHAAFPYASGTLEERRLKRLEDIGIDLHFFGMNWASLVQLRRMRALLLAQQFDIIHAHKGDDLALVLASSIGIKIPVLCTTRGVNFPLGFNRVKYRPSKLDRIIVVSEDSKQIVARCGVDPAKIEVITGGVDLSIFKPGLDGLSLRRKWGVPDYASLSCVVANLVWQKGHFVYLHAASLLKPDFPDLFHVFAGTGNVQRYQEKASQLGVSDRVIFAGFVDEPQMVYNASTFSVFPGITGEGISGILREAMACGLPVITSDVGGNTELIRHGVNGLVVPTGDPKALAQAIRTLLKNPGYARILAMKGRHEVTSYHFSQMRVRKIFNLYQRIAVSKGYRW